MAGKCWRWVGDVQTGWGLQNRHAPALLSNRVPSVSQLASATSAIPSPSESTATSVTTPDSLKTSDVDKFILGLAKKYALTMEMFLPDKVVFETDCPDPPVDFSSPTCYAKKSTEKAALVAELYASINYTLHARMQTNMFFNQVTDLIRWEVGKGKVYDIFKALILYPDHVVNEKKIFQNWIVIAKVIKVVICRKMTLYPKACNGHLLT
ncbi:uncharacterized protein BJ212DRAFT_1303022 [Suillus subaureus]|uniref:Uncharacterized protein n=1 Tax=Suillus subaureus TaxID=48587 RepID=A0A9P7J8Q4_9AGAM|nr:uncharacterized protein BJ212DRAFT_1303022 [Suillus subaureus]KAG1808409.1 hypothetical protein BJ212DRAFT_1303022 [Suillus subaureus]